ncbi:MAG: hypothetical protein ACYDCL_00285 [Myxococcales bacterium]
MIESSLPFIEDALLDRATISFVIEGSMPLITDALLMRRHSIASIATVILCRASTTFVIAS